MASSEVLSMLREASSRERRLRVESENCLRAVSFAPAVADGAVEAYRRVRLEHGMALTEVATLAALFLAETAP